MGIPARDRVAALLSTAGIGGSFALRTLLGGANNRVYRVDTNGRSVLVKAYFFHPDDPRNRLLSEFSFSKYAWNRGLRCLPEPLAADSENNLGLYEFVAGRRFRHDELTWDVIHHALQFYSDLNEKKCMPAARALPSAAEACFSLEEHLRCVDERLNRLGGIEDSDTVSRKASEFVARKLVPLWNTLRQHVIHRAARLGIDYLLQIVPEDRCVSPSDFGFHNAILADDGGIRFIDFEYAGWDDPAKLVCDFFCQPEVPVPMEYYEGFCQRVAASFSQPQFHVKRFRLMLPVYRMKWCCILLNEFLVLGSRRRGFAGGEVPSRDRKEIQLAKADKAFADIELSMPFDFDQCSTDRAGK